MSDRMTEQDFWKAVVAEMRNMNEHLDNIELYLEALSDACESFDACVAAYDPDGEKGMIRVCGIN